MPLVKCPFCGNSISSRATTCPKCKKEVFFCPECNNYIKDTNADCPSCGRPHSSFPGVSFTSSKSQKQNKTPTPPSTPYIPPKKKNNAQIVYWIIIGGIWAFAIIIWLIILVSD